MKTKTNRKRSSKRKSTFLLAIIYLAALFLVNGAIDRVRVMTEEEFAGLFKTTKTMTFENPAMHAMIAQAASERVEVAIAAPEPVEYTHSAILTAYNSVPEQTDGDPCIAADGTDICRFKGCVVAQNGVAFGTKVEIEGVGVCEVHDRKNSRYGSEWIDIYFGGEEKVAEALKFGKREAAYRVIGQ